MIGLIAHTAGANQIADHVNSRPYDADEPPNASACFGAAMILAEARSLGIPHTGLGAVIEGGVGVAWGNETHYADIEVYNNGEVMFSIRRRGEALEFMDIRGHGDLKQALGRVREVMA